jgi:hypothetical protein
MALLLPDSIGDGLRLQRISEVTAISGSDMLGKLQRGGLIRYQWGKITVLDRPGLEALSCECYPVVKTESDRLLTYVVK